jgi:hypothetical protein
MAAAALAAAATILGVVDGMLADAQERHADQARRLGSEVIASVRGAAYGTSFRCAELLVFEELAFQQEFRAAVVPTPIDEVAARATAAATARAEEVREQLEVPLDPSLELDEAAVSSLNEAECSEEGVSAAVAPAARLLEREASEVDRAARFGRLRGGVSMALVLVALIAALMAFRQTIDEPSVDDIHGPAA